MALSALVTLAIPWRRQWHPTPVLLPGKSHGRRSLVGCSPWGRQELDTTERLHFHFSFSCIGEGNGNPGQCSCLENPRDGGAWWAAVYGVTQSRTRLKQQQQQNNDRRNIGMGRGVKSLSQGANNALKYPHTMRQGRVETAFNWGHFVYMKTVP